MFRAQGAPKVFRCVILASAVIAVVAGLASSSAVGAPTAPSRQAHSRSSLRLWPGDLLVSSSVYQNDVNINVGTPLPPGCGTTAYNTPCGFAVSNGQYPYAFNNASVDSSFGVTSKIVLDEIRPGGAHVGTLDLPNSSQGAGLRQQLVTSFSSKSELALNLSPNGRDVTFMGYDAPVDIADVSNANTPGAIDPTNPDTGAYYRAVAVLGSDGKFHFTLTNAYSGNNGRAAILDSSHGAQAIYAAGNAGNGANPEPAGVVLGAGAQLLRPSYAPEQLQQPAAPTPIGSFNVAQLGLPTDKAAKDDNFRGIAISGNVVYYTKGSGGNGVDTVYFVDSTGKACPSGVGLPEPGAALPTTILSENPSEAGTGAPGLTPEDMCILKGFPTSPAKTATDASDYPFGMWFANPTTLYIADEGSGTDTYANGEYSVAAASKTAGLQKWSFDQATQTWALDYGLQSGLDLGDPYAPLNYPTGDNSGPGGTGLPWSPATDGIRTLTGRTNPDGTVTIWAVTSTVSGSGDQGADPDKLVTITDDLGATSLPTGERITTLETARAGTVLRGVSFTPGTKTWSGAADAP